MGEGDDEPDGGEERAGTDPRRGHLELRIQSDGEFICPADRLASLLAVRVHDEVFEVAAP